MSRPSPSFQYRVPGRRAALQASSNPERTPPSPERTTRDNAGVVPWRIGGHSIKGRVSQRRTDSFHQALSRPRTGNPSGQARPEIKLSSENRGCQCSSPIHSICRISCQPCRTPPERPPAHHKKKEKKRDSSGDESLKSAYGSRTVPLKARSSIRTDSRSSTRPCHGHDGPRCRQCRHERWRCNQER